MAAGVEQPTNEQVRERLGGGSLSHISPVMREWRAQRQADVDAALAMPAELKQAIETAVSQVWASASKLATGTVDAVRQEADATIATATGERDEALDEITRLEARLTALEASLAGKDQMIGEAQSARDQVAGDNAVLTARLAERDGQITDLKTELNTARADNKTLQGQLVEIARGAGGKKR